MRAHHETSNALVRAALQAQWSAMQAMQSAYAPDWIHLDLSMGQLKALVALASANGLIVGELAAALGVSKPSASILVDRLVQLGLVDRMEDPEDRRRTLVTLTTEGSELVARLQQRGGARMARWMEQMQPDDLEALTRGLRALAQVVAHENEKNNGSPERSPRAENLGIPDEEPTGGGSSIQ